jgi:hypothetical protein
MDFEQTAHMAAYNTNLAGEFHVLSMLYRLGANATLTLGNKKSVDIVVVRFAGDSITIDVKAIAGTTLWPLDNFRGGTERHFLVFVSFLGRIGNTDVLPDVYIVPSIEIEALMYHAPGGKRKGMPLSALRRHGLRYRNAWERLL